MLVVVLYVCSLMPLVSLCPDGDGGEGPEKNEKYSISSDGECEMPCDCEVGHEYLQRRQRSLYRI